LLPRRIDIHTPARQRAAPRKDVGTRRRGAARSLRDNTPTEVLGPGTHKRHLGKHSRRYLGPESVVKTGLKNPKEATDGRSETFELVIFSNYEVTERAPYLRETRLTLGEPTWKYLDRRWLDLSKADLRAEVVDPVA
jgi:hypothetical protein